MKCVMARKILMVKWKIGKGDKIRFWLDNWHREDVFACAFPRLFSISTQQQALARCSLEVGS